MATRTQHCLFLSELDLPAFHPPPPPLPRTFRAPASPAPAALQIAPLIITVQRMASHLRERRADAQRVVELFITKEFEHDREARDMLLQVLFAVSTHTKSRCVAERRL